MRTHVFLPVCGLLLALAATLGYFAMGRPMETGPSMACADALTPWTQVLGRVHLRQCVVDLRNARPARGWWADGMAVKLAADEEGMGVEWQTRDPDVLRRVARIPADPDRRRRYVRRHHAELVYEREVAVNLIFSLPRDDQLAEDPPDGDIARVFCLALLPWPLGGLLLLIWQQRRWRRSAPTRF